MKMVKMKMKWMRRKSGSQMDETKKKNLTKRMVRVTMKMSMMKWKKAMTKEGLVACFLKDSSRNQEWVVLRVHQVSLAFLQWT